ncbi:MAG: M3 family oligoendopeptidase [Alphaproteobacteria bacterium]|nr:M3 family oligoendopeptidase [Alphaproteobacteria bacterium]
MTEADPNDLHATDVVWDLEPLLHGESPEAMLDRAEALANGLAAHRGTLASLDAPAFAAVLGTLEDIHDLLIRVGSHANLTYCIDTTKPEHGRALQNVDERSNAIGKELLFIELEWAAMSDAQAEALLSHDALAFCRHWLRSARRYRPHLLTEAEERILADKDLTGSRAFGRLFEELTARMTVELAAGGEPQTLPLEVALSKMMHADRAVRDDAAEGVSAALNAGLHTRAFIYNTLLADKSLDDRLRHYPTWISSRNLSNEASDASVQALLDAVQARYPLAQRWYSIKAKLLGIEQLGEHDRYAPLASVETRVTWPEGKRLVLGAYASFSPALADRARRFFDERRIHAPVQPGKVGGAFCTYTTPRLHPYVLLNWTSTANDVLVLAHELGHALHGDLAREQGVFQQSTPLTLAETASVFGETVTFASLMEAVDSDEARLALLGQAIEGNMATVFRQAAMCRFEHRVHTERREQGELSVDQLNAAWLDTQRALYGDSVALGDRYAVWWSYIPHFFRTPGYVYAYSYGQLLALSVYQRYLEGGEAFVPAYLDMLAAGGSMPPADIARLVDCDLEDPGFWDAGLDLIAHQVDAAEDLARQLGRL